MRYLVLRGFRSFGKWLEKGTYVDETEIRSPRLRITEGKIAKAVPSSNIPAEEINMTTPQEHFEDNNKEVPKLTLKFKT